MTAIGGTRFDSSYSRFVTVMKLALLLGAAGVIGLLFTWSTLYDMPERVQVVSASFSVSESASGHRMVNARYSGTDRNNNPYTLAAGSIVQRGSGDRFRVALDTPEADFTTADGAWVAVFAARGTFAREAQQATLEGDVTVYHDSGHQFRTDAVTIDFSQAVAVADTAVTGGGPTAAVQSAGFRISPDDSAFELVGPARLVFYPDAQER